MRLFLGCFPVWVALLAASGAHAAVFTFTRIVDTNSPITGGNGTYTGFSTAAFDGGAVAFHGFGNNLQQGLYVHNQGGLSRIADRTTSLPENSGTFQAFSAFHLNNGKVAFKARSDGDQQGIYTNQNGPLETVADLSTEAPNGDNFTGLDQPTLDDGVVFFGSTPVTQRGIYRRNGGVIETLVDTNSPIPGGNGNFSFVGIVPNGYENGDLAFRGAASGQNGIYSRFDGTIDLIADLNSDVPGIGISFVDFDTPPLSDRKIAFRAVSDAGAGVFADFGDGLFSFADTGTAIPEGFGLFTNFGVVSIDGSHVAFRGQSPGQQGIYTNLLGGLTKVIDLGDELDGKQISALVHHEQALVGNSIAFRAEFTDGSQGIYLATAVPEPSTLFVWSFLGMGGLAVNWRRRREAANS